MQWANALSTQPSLEAALREVVEEATQKLQTAQLQSVLSRQLQATPASSSAILSGYVPDPSTRPHLAVLFVSAAFASEFSRVMPLLQGILEVDALIGCSGGGVAGGSHEIEEGPAISLSLAMLPNVQVGPFHVVADQLPDPDAPPQQWIERVGVATEAHPHFILLADGGSSKISDLLQGLDYAYPNAVKVGGLASGARSEEGNALFWGRSQPGEPAQLQMVREGTVGVALSGNVIVDAVVAQGCRPIGKPMQVSEAQRNVILKLDTDPPLQILQDLVTTLSPKDQQLIRHSLFIGVLMDEFKDKPRQGDFLIRVILGLDPRVGAIAIGDRIRTGQTVQFHLRDAQASAEDLYWVLERYQEHHSEVQPAGALMFACLGRGEHLYEEPDFDSHVFQEVLGEIPLGGLFCNGEIGPVGNSTFLHGYTSSFGIFRSKD